MSSRCVCPLALPEGSLPRPPVVSALSLEAFDGLEAPFISFLHYPSHEGRSRLSRRMHSLKGSQLQKRPKKQVQDPYSYRCIPQVHGASWDTFLYVSDVVAREINSVTDNPTIFPDRRLSG